MRVKFREVQRTGWYIFIPVLAVAGLIWYGFYEQIVLGEPFGDKPASDAEMWVLQIIFGLLLPYLLLSLKLVVQVDDQAIRVVMFPFLSKKMAFSEIKKAEVLSYSPLAYGGWGIRWAPGKGWAYIVRGRQGVSLELKDGRKILIGSQMPEQLLRNIDY